MIKLANFQLQAIRELTEKMNEDKKEIIFKSPTGSGKTIILTHFIDQYGKGNFNKIFIWLTPGKGELEKQSKGKMDKYIHNSQTKLLSDVMTEGFVENDVCFINWEKLTKKGNNALKEGEKRNFQEHVQKALNDGLEFIVIIDEAHQNDTVKAKEIIELFNALKLIRTSATPTANSRAALIEVDEADVIEEGLIKKLLVINEDFASSITVSNPTEFLLEKAFEKYKELKAAYIEQATTVNPLVIVQLPNDSDGLLSDVEKYLESQGITYENGLLAIWLSDRKENLENIEEKDAKPIFIIIKQAIATGWDCPRAQVLVKLRENSNEVFEIQTIGRIRRMPEVKHYNRDLLDSCYLFTFDEKFTEGVKTELGKNALNAQKLYLKNDYKNIKLVSEQRSGIVNSSDATKALQAIVSYFKDTYDLTSAKNENKNKIEKVGYIFSNQIRTKTITGLVQTLKQDEFNNLNNVELVEELNTHRHGREYHNRVSRIGLKTSLTYDKANTIIRRLFDKNVVYKGKFLQLEVKELYAFVINNYDKLLVDMIKAVSRVGNGTQSALTLAFTKEFKFPEEFLFTYDEKNKVQRAYSKNVYKGYLSSAEKRSDSEKSFEKYCEASSTVEWIYKNGDKGAEYFSLVYQDNGGTTKLFYPDYIVATKDEIWIIETKGGFSRSGQSEDIDVFSPKKFEVLKNYLDKYKLKGGFVRKDKSNGELFICMDGYSDDISSDNWLLLSDIL